MRGALICAKKEITIRLRDHWALVMWIMIPLSIGGMITALSGGSGGPSPTAQLLVVDEDQSFVSQVLLGALGQAGDLIQVNEVELEEGQALIAAGEGSALLIIPPGFSEAVLNETPAELALLTNPAQRILPGIIEEFLKVLTDGVFYLHRVFGDQLQIVNQQIDALPDGESELFQDALIAELSISFNNAVESIVQYLDPPILDLAPAAEEDSSDQPGFALLFFPGAIFMGLLFASQGLSDGFWKEREDGTLRRTLISPLSLADIFAGRVMAGAVMLFFLAGSMTTLGFVYHGLGIEAWFPTVAWLTLSGLVLFGLMAFLQLIAPSQKSASLVTNLLVFPLMMAGGAFFPFEALPGWLRSVGEWVPNGFLLERLKSYLIYDGGMTALLTGLPYALAMAVVLWAACAWRLRAFAGASK